MVRWCLQLKICTNQCTLWIHSFFNNHTWLFWSPNSTNFTTDEAIQIKVSLFGESYSEKSVFTCCSSIVPSTSSHCWVISRLQFFSKLNIEEEDANASWEYVVAVPMFSKCPVPDIGPELMFPNSQQHCHELFQCFLLYDFMKYWPGIQDHLLIQSPWFL